MARRSEAAWPRLSGSLWGSSCLALALSEDLPLFSRTSSGFTGKEKGQERSTGWEEPPSSCIFSRSWAASRLAPGLAACWSWIMRPERAPPAVTLPTDTGWPRPEMVCSAAFPGPEVPGQRWVFVVGKSTCIFFFLHLIFEKLFPYASNIYSL